MIMKKVMIISIIPLRTSRSPQRRELIISRITLKLEKVILKRLPHKGLVTGLERDSHGLLEIKK
jgi:hypothetical protein